MDLLRHHAPSSQALLQGAAKRGHNLGSAVAALCRLLDTWHAQAQETAIAEALAANPIHMAAGRQIMEQRAQSDGQPPPLPIPLPDVDRVRDRHVQTHDMQGYDQEVSS